MSDLTREEVRAACEAAGLPEPTSDDEFEIDPLYLLEYWRMADPKARSWSLESPLPVDGVLRENTTRACANDDSDPNSAGVADEDTALAAAVRAVNAWAEKREGKGP